MGDLYPINYDEAMSMLVLIIWQGARKGKLESLYSNIVWIPIEVLEGIKLIGISQSIRKTNK